LLPALFAQIILLSPLTPASAKELWYHVGAIQNYDSDLVQREHLDEARAFLDACKGRGLTLGKECFVFIDSRLLPPGERLPFVSGTPTRNRVLRAFRRAILQAKSGDQIVLSIFDHGYNGPVHGSCIRLSGSSICKSDLKKIFKEKQLGVKIFLMAQACHSGAVTQLSHSELCTFVGASKYKPSHGARFWQKVTKLKPLTLKELKERYEFWGTRQDGGGFASQLITEKICSQSLTEEEGYANLELRSLVQEQAKRIDSVINSYTSIRPSPIKERALFFSRSTLKRVGYIDQGARLFEGDLTRQCRNQRAPFGLCADVKQYLRLQRKLKTQASNLRLAEAALYLKEMEALALDQIYLEVDPERASLGNLWLRTEYNSTDLAPLPQTIINMRADFLDDLITEELYISELDTFANTLTDEILQSREELIESTFELGRSKVIRDLYAALTAIEANICTMQFEVDLKTSSLFTLSYFAGDGVPSTFERRRQAFTCEESFKLGQKKTKLEIQTLRNKLRL
jgi:hypothetical protein